MSDSVQGVQQPLTNYLYSKADNAHMALSGTFELSPVCNFACKMCYIRKTPDEVRNHGRPIFSKEQWLDIAREAKKKGMLFLLLTGGEPFLWPEFFELYEELIEMGFLISINTNGSMIDDRVIARLKKHPPMRINITLYGASDETYERLCGVKGVFSKVDYAINALREAGIIVKLNGSLTPQNECDLEACVAYANERKLIYEVVTYMFPPVRRDGTMVGRNERFTPAQAAEFRLKNHRLQYGEEAYIQHLKDIVKGAIPPPGLDEGCIDPLDGKVRCRAGKASFWITWDGYMTPCGTMPEPKEDLIELGFEKAWEKTGENICRMTLSGICNKCGNKLLCHACAAMAYAETGKFSGVPIYLCQMVAEMKKIAQIELQLIGQLDVDV